MTCLKSFFAVLSITAISYGSINSITVQDTVETGQELTYSFSSTSDTVLNRLYMETDIVPGLDTTDQPLYVYSIIDNNVDEIKDPDMMFLQDSDTNSGAFQFGPMKLSFPSGKYYIVLADEDMDTTGSFFVTPLSSFARSISGKIETPEGKSPANFWIAAEPDGQSGDYRFIARSDSAGNFVIQIDSVYPNFDFWSVRLDVDAIPLGNYLATDTIVSIIDGNISNVLISISAPSSYFTGVVKDQFNNLIRNATIYIYDKWTNSSRHDQTDSNGVYWIPAEPGGYQIGLWDESLDGYMIPSSDSVTMIADDTVTHNFQILKADQKIYGKLFIDGQPGVGNYRFYCRTNSGYQSSAEADTNGLFAFAVAAGDSYTVHQEMSSDVDTIPSSYINQNASNAMLHPGDTIVFSYIPGNTIVRGQILDDNGDGVKGMRVSFSSATGNASFETFTSDSGFYTIYVMPDTFRVTVMPNFKDTVMKYMQLTDTTIFIGDGDTINVTRIIAKSDAIIFGRIRQAGEIPDGEFRIEAFKEGISTSTVSDSLGWFKLAVSSKVTNYTVRLVLGGEYDSLPTNFILHNSSDRTASAGDTVMYEMIQAATSTIRTMQIPSKLDMSMHSSGAGTSVRFQLPVKETVTLSIMDLQGKTIQTIHKGTMQPGYYSVAVSGTIASGRYIATLKTSRSILSKSFLVR